MARVGGVASCDRDRPRLSGSTKLRRPRQSRSGSSCRCFRQAPWSRARPARGKRHKLGRQPLPHPPYTMLPRRHRPCRTSSYQSQPKPAKPPKPTPPPPKPVLKTDAPTLLTGSSQNPRQAAQFAGCTESGAQGERDRSQSGRWPGHRGQAGDQAESRHLKEAPRQSSRPMTRKPAHETASKPDSSRA